MRERALTVVRLEQLHRFFPLLGLALPLGDGVEQVAVDGVNHVRADQGVPAKAAAVHNPDCQGRAVQFLLWEFLKQKTPNLIAAQPYTIIYCVGNKSIV